METRHKNIKFEVKRALPILLILAFQVVVIIFFISIGCAVIEGAKFATRFGESRCLILQPKENEKERFKELLVANEEVKYVFEGVYMNTRSNLIFFSSCGTPFIKLKATDLECLMKEFDIALKEGALPKHTAEMILTSESIYLAESKMGAAIGKGIGDNILMLDDVYKVNGIITSKANVALGISEEEGSQLIIILKQQMTPTLEAFLAGHQMQYEERFMYKEKPMFVIFMKRNIQYVGLFVLGLLFLQLWVTLKHLLAVYLEEYLEELALFHVIGYSLKQIRVKMIKRYLSIIALGGGLGLIIGEVCVILFKYLYCEIRGIPYSLWHPLFFLLPFIMLSVLSLIIIRALCIEINKVNWIETLLK